MNDISILTNSLDRFGISYNKDQIDKLYKYRR